MPSWLTHIFVELTFDVRVQNFIHSNQMSYKMSNDRILNSVMKHDANLAHAYRALTHAHGNVTYS